MDARSIPAHAPPRRHLRFALDLRDDESVPGAIARAVAEHHLVRIGAVLKGSGHGRYAGATQLADATTLRRIAQVIRCDPQHLVTQAGRRLVEPGDRRLQHFVDFDGLVVPSGHLELKRRRIAPGALLASPHHRQDWMLNVLPYSTETLERLVDECPACGVALGWTRSVGIGRCEHCLATVPPSPLPSLPAELAADYRLFASLVSLRSAGRAAAVEALAPRLRDMTSGGLARFAMRLGLDCGEDEGRRAWQTRAGHMSPERLARTVCRGIGLLRTWPEGIVEWAQERVDHARDESACRRDLNRRIRRIAWGDSGFEDQRELVHEAFPAFASPRARADLGGRLYTGREADRILPGFATHAPEIRRLGLVTSRSDGARGTMESFIYHSAPIDAAGASWRDATPVTTIIARLGLPLYAVEQMIGSGLLGLHDDPILAVVMRRRQAVASIFDDLLARLRRRARRRAPPSSTLPIGWESRRIGGGPKPWSEIFHGLLDGRIPFWLDGEPDAEHFFVERNGLDAFIDRPPPVHSENRPLSPAMSTGDAAELLNVVPNHVVRLASAGVLTRTVGLRAMTIARDEVERLARHHVSPAELARRARTSAEAVNDRLRIAGFTSFHGLWDRTAALDALPLA
ncbi:hypothetical protein GCM10022268_19520 [Sphingomonas cynarae]|uniref:TniQ protein n=2 Tax=Sphingomonas cynarae TaxID=930197 RepID=A0ABP7E0G1_9SPHN